MTVPFICVLIALVLTLASKAPVVVAQLQQPGGYDNRHPRNQQACLSGWGARAVAAHLNAFEAFPGFAAAAIIAHLAEADPLWSTRLAVTFVVARLVYHVFYLADLHLLRTTVFTVGFLATCALLVLPWLV